MIKKIVFLMTLCFGFSVLAQENLIYQQIQNEKINGEKFSLVQGVFTKDKLNSEVTREFKDVKEVSFFQFNANAIPHTQRSFSFELPLNNKTIVLELVAVDDDFYDYVVTMDKGEVFSANRDIKHYRGVVKGDKNSLVAISFFGDEVGGVISNEYGNFNIGMILKKGVVFYQDTNLIKEFQWTCEEVESGENEKVFLNEEVVTALEGQYLLSNCVKIQVDVAYDMYVFNQYNFLKTESYMATLFNQVALLYQNEAIRIGISNMRIWTSTDPFVNYSTADSFHLEAYRSYVSGDFSGNISMFFTKKTNGGIAYINNSGSLCMNKSTKVGISGIKGNVEAIPIYSRPVKVITHELGHIFGSHHTHACVWNGNNTAIDNCGSYYYYSKGKSPNEIEGFECLNTSNPILPFNGGTIMSYCDQNFTGSPGVNFNAGFGIQPGNRIRSVVAFSSMSLFSCLNDCPINCMENILVTSTISNLNYDLKQVSNNITATNKINSGGMALYMGNSVHLKNGFKASQGAVFMAKVLPCSPNNNIAITKDITGESDVNQEVESVVNLYPNPTSGLTTVVSDKSIVSWELFNEIGYLIDNKKIDYLKEFQIDMSYFKKGLYLIRLTMEDGTIESQKVIKK